MMFQDPAKKTGSKEERLRKNLGEWDWRKKYRVWEANRRVFVYPEDWVEPDLALPIGFLVSLRKMVAVIRAQCGRGTQELGNPKLLRLRGIPVLLTGKSRTGALVTAQTIARDLRMGLSRIDLSAVVSKYIGETEKNLRRVFAAA